MINRIKSLIVGLSVAAFAVVPALALAAPVSAQSNINIGDALACGSQGDVGGIDNPNCNIDEGAQSEKLNDIISLVINIFSVVVGLAAVIMIIIGGLKYITSGGDSGNIQSAKNTILYAIIGLVVVALAQFIVRFVLSRVSSV